MARMIDADVAIKRFRGWLEGPHEATVYNLGFDDAIRRVLGAIEHIPTLSPPNGPLTSDELRQMSGEPVWVEEVEHWALIDIEKSGQWAGIPFAVWAENGANFTYNIEDRELHCFRHPPEDD